jgi:hypothetical protein
MLVGYVPAALVFNHCVIVYEPKFRSYGVGFVCAASWFNAPRRHRTAVTDQMVNFFMDVAIEIVTECD